MRRTTLPGFNLQQFFCLLAPPGHITCRVVPLHVHLVDVPDAEVALVDLEADGVLALALLLPLHQRDDHRAVRLVVVRVGICSRVPPRIS